MRILLIAVCVGFFSFCAKKSVVDSAPLSPTNLTVTGTSTTLVTMDWIDASNNASSFEIDRASDVNFSKDLAHFTTTKSDTDKITFQNSIPSGSVVFYYRVRASNEKGSSDWTKTVALPVTPKMLTAKVSGASISLSWTVETIKETTGYEIQRSIDINFTAEVVKLTSSTASDTAMADNPVNGKYYYRIRAVNGNEGFSAYVNMTDSILITTSTLCKNPNTAGSVYLPRNLWAWQKTSDIINNATDQAKFFTFAEKNNVKTVYLNVKSMIDNYGTLTPETETQTNLPIFIALAAGKCMDVQLLLSNAGSYLSDAEATNNNFPAMSAVVSKVVQYVATIPGTHPSAIHWDIESQQLADWTANKKKYIQRLVNAFQKTRATLASTGIKQAADLMHSLDNATDYTGVTCDPNNNTTTPQYSLLGSQCMIRVLDQIDLMDYRDKSIQSISQVSTEIPYASSNLNFNGNTTAIVIGQEVSTNSDLTLTFYDEVRSLTGNTCVGESGTRCMEIELQTIQHAYNTSAGYSGHGLEKAYTSTNPLSSSYSYPAAGSTAGISIHQYDAYNALDVINNFL